MTLIRDRLLFKCQGAGYKVGGHMKFHVASRGVTINFFFPAEGEGGGACKNCYNKITKKFPHSLCSLDFFL